MSKNTRRVSVTRTVTFTTTIDMPGYPEETDANMLVLMGGAAGNTGVLSIGEMLAGATLSNSGVISRGNWSVTGTSINIEPYSTRPASTALAVGKRVASISPPAGYEAALGKLFVVGIAGTTGAGAAEPNWATTDGLTTNDGTVTYYTIPKFPTVSTYAQSTVYPVGSIIKPAATSLKEYLVTAANTSAATTPTWTSADSIGSVVSFQTGGSAVCISGVLTYGFNTTYSLGDVIKPTAGSAQEYIVTVAGTSDTSALSATVGASVTRGRVTMKRII